MRTKLAVFGLAVAIAVAGWWTPSVSAQGQPIFNEREVKAMASSLDKAGVWGMDFRFKDPRILTIKLPGRGDRVVWYLWYQLINRSGKPQEVAPYFELVTLDNPGKHRDEILITAEEAIKKIEDRSGANYQDIKNTVLISKFAIPPSKEEALPRAVTGVAIWDVGPADPKLRNPKSKDEFADTTRFSIFIRGLSNGFIEVDAPAVGLPSITQYKTLQLNFKRVGDRFSTDSRDIQFVSPAQWIYRSAGPTIPNEKIGGR